MNSKKRYLLLFLVLFSVLHLQAQEILTIENATKIALENNFEIKIASNNAKIGENNNTIGNTGMLPIVTASVVDNNSIQNTSQTRQDDSTVSLNNAKNNSLNYGVGLGWTVFDGLKMFAKADQLKALQKLGEAQLKKTILIKLGQVSLNYYDLVQQQQQLTALDSSIVISKQRLELAKNRYTIGKASKLEVLNAQVDLNTDQVALLRQKESYANTKIALNQILARDSKTPFEVADEIMVDEKLIYSDLLDLAQKQNPELEAQIINNRIAELELKKVKSDRYPTISLTSAYNFADSQSSLGFTKQSNSRGLNYGFTASMNIFDGFNQNRNEKNAQIEVENSKIFLDQQNTILTAQLAISFQTYLTNLELINLEANNETIAKQNLEITLDKFHIGTITSLEFRTAQLNYINAKVRYSDAQFQAKLSEIALKELAGNISF
ncbi:TolC family protein [Flavobacterium cellulosilyticum]|uniref:TolC family protein n=1 Tax=Flavobacterium cellulosilyticum TaxID=2541731 RepID=A0A4R5C9T4_9FLAO|nr:TolC family protein [Flavobacterium cellulosilyticum]TDD93824.1 TolC family protein [Flavobacterium cellulosilyticum]